MIRNDGKYIIYIIKHLYQDKPENEWANSGDCEQWFPTNITRTEYKKLVYSKGYSNHLPPMEVVGKKLEYMDHLIKKTLLKSLVKFQNGILNIDLKYVDYC